MQKVGTDLSGAADSPDSGIASAVGAGEAWLVCRTQPQHEHRVATLVSNRGGEGWVPTFPRERRWSDRRVTLEQPFFPNYCFVRWPLERWSQLLHVGGVRTVLKTARGEPAVVTDSEVEALRAFTARVAAHGLEPEPISIGAWRAGDPVRVRRGPLAGLRGRVVRRRGAQKLVLAIEALGEGVAVTVALQDLELLDPEALRATV